MVAALAGCSSQAVLRCESGQRLQFHDLLYFGTSRGDGGQHTVTTAEWNVFLGEVLTRHFPDGLTVLTGTGQWRSSSGAIVREGSHVLSLVHPGTPETETSITAAVEAYKTTFNQESILRVRSPACVAFL
ncbi:DUF3574 domain-containing protein [uncultured Microbulbifer sp.]|uniref:DUF3574 domain-containing protein n=1 Tax=uncultured Microbulbifer sp. TaxID=348147 RepID=UPI00262C08A4|nr:DUF3574 domain-containing protein [uncultured Microbulbifer sp.]